MSSVLSADERSFYHNFVSSVLFSSSCPGPYSILSSNQQSHSKLRYAPLLFPAYGYCCCSSNSFFSGFQQLGENELTDSLGILNPFWEKLRLLHAGFSTDTIRIVHIGDSHIRGRILPRTTGTLLTETFGAISYTDMGINGAFCITFTRPDRISDIAALHPDLVILSFGTNESHNRRYNTLLHYRQMDELVRMLRDSLPNVPLLMTTPPGSYDSFRKSRRRRTYSINPRTAIAVETMRRFADDNGLAVWDMYEAVGGRQRACLNWQEAKLMRPDHVHYLPEGYVLQGELFYQALLKAYNDYVGY